MEGEITCEFCGYEFDEACGRYGCPNCLGEGLEEMPQENGETRRKMKVRDDIEAQIEAVEQRILHLEVEQERDRALLETLRWVIGDGDLPTGDA